MLCCFGWSYCSFKPALRDRESDMGHQYSLTIPLAHKRRSWILGSQYHHITTAAAIHSNNQKQRSLESCLRISLKDFTLGMKLSLCSIQLPHGSYYIKREKDGLLSHWKYMSSGIERSRGTLWWGKKEQKDTEIKRITSKHQNDTILHKYMCIENSSSWYP